MGCINFVFTLTKNEKEGYDISIRYTRDGSSCAILLDNTFAWIELVKNERAKGKSVAEIVNEFRDGEWDNLENDPEYGFRAQWNKMGETVNEESYRQAVDLFFATLTSIADGVFAGMPETVVKE